MLPFKDLLESVSSRVARGHRVSAELSNNIKAKADGVGGIKTYGHKDYSSIDRYVGMDSGEINRKLMLKRPRLNGNEIETHDAMMRHMEPIGSKVRLYSGSSHDFGEMARNSPDHVIHNKPFISTSHQYPVARRFATMGAEDGDTRHIMVIDAEPHHKALMLGHTINPREHEVVLPPNTKLKYHGTKVKTEHVMLRTSNAFTPRTVVREKAKVNIHYHHFTIHSQE